MVGSNGNCVSGRLDDPVVDCCDELDATPFLLTVKAGEYQLTMQWYPAGANHNARIGHPARMGAGSISVLGDPMANMGFRLPGN
jgi:hypothetical protein